jgi:uncharacterized integral membrane protein
VLFALVLIILLIFILQNQTDVKLSFLGAHGSMPIAVAMLFAAVAGALLVAIPGVGRMIQLRKVARRGMTPSPQSPPPAERPVETPPTAPTSRPGQHR